MSEVPEYQPKPYLKKGMSTPKKLLIAGGFLAFVAFIIGGEDRPGPVMWAQQATEDNFAEDGDEQPNEAGTPTPASTIAASDSETDAWYGEVQVGQYDPKPTVSSEPTTPTASAAPASQNGATGTLPVSNLPGQVVPEGAVPNSAIVEIVN